MCVAHLLFEMSVADADESPSRGGGAVAPGRALAPLRPAIAALSSSFSGARAPSCGAPLNRSFVEAVEALRREGTAVDFISKTGDHAWATLSGPSCLLSISLSSLSSLSLSTRARTRPASLSQGWSPMRRVALLIHASRLRTDADVDAKLPILDGAKARFLVCAALLPPKNGVERLLVMQDGARGFHDYRCKESFNSNPELRDETFGVARKPPALSRARAAQPPGSSGASGGARAAKRVRPAASSGRAAEEGAGAASSAAAGAASSAAAAGASSSYAAAPLPAAAKKRRVRAPSSAPAHMLAPPLPVAPDVGIARFFAELSGRARMSSACVTAYANPAYAYLASAGAIAQALHDKEALGRSVDASMIEAPPTTAPVAAAMHRKEADVVASFYGGDFGASDVEAASALAPQHKVFLNALHADNVRAANAPASATAVRSAETALKTSKVSVAPFAVEKTAAVAVATAAAAGGAPLETRDLALSGEVEKGKIVAGVVLSGRSCVAACRQVADIMSPWSADAREGIAVLVRLGMTSAAAAGAVAGAHDADDSE